MRLLRILPPFLLLVAAAACDSGSDRAPAAVDAPPPVTERAPKAESSSRPATARPRVVVLGDSLTAGLGITPDQAFPAVLQRRIDAAGYHYEVVNAGVSGDTSAGGLRRLDWALEGDVRVLVLALGANDGLRGLAVPEMTRNLSAIIERARSRNVQVLLAGMEAPPNFGPEYTAEFRAAYKQLARDHQVTLVPFLLEGVAGNAQLNQRDGIHPNVEGARIVADVIWPRLQPMLDSARR